MVKMSGCGMPKACVSCEHYTHAGFAHDKHSPFKDWSGNTKNNGRVQFGVCALHRSEVFATEICNTYEATPGIQVLEVNNRVEAKEERQERLF